MNWLPKHTSTRIAVYVVGLLAALVLAVVFFLEDAALAYANHRLEHIDSRFSGHVEDLDIDWWHRRVEANSFVIKTPANKKPYIAVDTIRIEARDLSLTRDTQAYVAAYGANLNLIRSRDERAQLTEGIDWLRKIIRKSPLAIRRVDVKNSQACFRDYTAGLSEDVCVSVQSASANLNGTGKGFAANGDAAFKIGSSTEISHLSGKVDATGGPVQGASAKLDLKLSNLAELSKLTSTYADLRLGANHVRAKMHATWQPKTLDGNAKIRLKDVHVESASGAEHPVGSWFLAVAARGGLEAFRVGPNAVGIRAPINGEVDLNHGQVRDDMVGVLKHAVLHAEPWSPE